MDSYESLRIRICNLACNSGQSYEETVAEALKLYSLWEQCISKGYSLLLTVPNENIDREFVVKLNSITSCLLNNSQE